MMTLFLQVTLVIHIIAGFLSLLTGLVSVVSVKGSRLHRTSGKIFFAGMIGICLSAVIISSVKGNAFLFHIGIFAFYQNHFGYRAIRNKSLVPSAFDWTVLVVASVNSILMIWSLDLILMVFGSFSCLGAIGTWRASLNARRGVPLSPLAWLRVHIGMMMGAFISTVTAFVVVNFASLNLTVIPTWLVWLLPSMLLTPLIIYWTQKYTAKPAGI